MKTRTGGFPLGFRRGGSAWQKDLDGMIAWALENGIEVVDLTSDVAASLGPVTKAGLRIGSIDLPVNKGMISPDKGMRAEAIARNAESIRACAAYGAMNHFVVMLPEQPNLPRKESFGYMVESYGELVPVLEANNARLVIEGWPGPGALCCTPEADRAFFKALPSMALGLNYDPSHLVRQNIDPLRFLGEFGNRVYHIHGKDTAFLTENWYEFGTEQPPTFARPMPFAGMAWRYTIPGHGVTRWAEVTRALVAAGYQGAISIELEDANFNGSEEGEKLGILQGTRFLQGC